MTHIPLPRRGFLRGLAALPLIGGSVSIIGAPVRAAVPITPDLLESYKTWLDFEARFLAWEMADNPAVLARYKFPAGAEKRDRWEAIRTNFSEGYYFPNGPEPSTRAAAVLGAVGFEWRLP